MWVQETTQSSWPVCIGVWDKEDWCQAKEAALGVRAWVRVLNGHREERYSYAEEEEHFPKQKLRHMFSQTKQDATKRNLTQEKYWEEQKSPQVDTNWWWGGGQAVLGAGSRRLKDSMAHRGQHPQASHGLVRSLMTCRHEIKIAIFIFLILTAPKWHYSKADKEDLSLPTPPRFSAFCDLQREIQAKK